MAVGVGGLCGGESLVEKGQGVRGWSLLFVDECTGGWAWSLWMGGVFLCV